MQHIFVALIVSWGCAYAVWTLAPKGLKQWLAGRLASGAWWPAAVRRALQRVASRAGGCACDGCDRGASSASAAPTRKASAEQPIRIHRKLNR